MGRIKVWKTLNTNHVSKGLIYLLLFISACTSNEDRANQFFEQGDYEQALEYFEKALQMDKNNWTIIYNIGRCHEELDDPKTAIKYYSKSLNIWVSVEARLGRARCYYALEDDDSAILEATNVLRVNPGNFEALYIRGKSHLRETNYYRARNDMNEALLIDKEHINAHYHRAIAKSQLYDNHGAIRDMNFFIEKTDNFNQAYYNRGIIYQRMRDYDKAIEDFDRAIKLNLQTADVYLRRGACFNEFGYKNKACADFKYAANFNKEASDNAVEQFCY